MVLVTGIHVQYMNGIKPLPYIYGIFLILAVKLLHMAPSRGVLAVQLNQSLQPL